MKENLSSHSNKLSTTATFWWTEEATNHCLDIKLHFWVCLRLVCEEKKKVVMIQERTLLCVWSVWSVQHWILYITPREKMGKKDLLLNTNPSQDLNIALCVQFFFSSWREIDHTPELILNHSTPDALSWGLCPLLSKHGRHTKEEGRVWAKGWSKVHYRLCALLYCQLEQIHTHITMH